MNPSTTALTLNMQLPNIAAVAWAVQGDQLSRFVECTLVDGSTAWNPQTGYHGVIRAHKPDGTACVYDVDEDGNPAVTWTGNVATVTIAQQAVTVAGTVLMQLEFYDSNNARITAFAWAMNVQPSAVTDTEFLSTDYYNILTLQIAAVLGSSGHPPYINSDTKNWMIWDENVGDYADSGYPSVGETGPYFTPAVDASGNISWTNNGGLPNPASQNIKGPQGVSIASVSKASGTGAPGTTDVYNVNLDNSTVAGQFNVYNGADGAGSPGSQLPLMDGTASAGSAVAYSREDHVHPQDSDIDELKTNLSTVKSDIGIVEDTNTATHTIAQGQYVIWKDALYTASQAIPLGTTLSSSNLTEVSGGGLNALSVGYGVGETITLSSTAIQATKDGMLAVSVDPGGSYIATYYVNDNTLGITYVATSLAGAGSPATMAVPWIKGHNYRNTYKANASTINLTLYPFEIK